jgi:hypothetical protein
MEGSALTPWPRSWHGFTLEAEGAMSTPQDPEAGPSRLIHPQRPPETYGFLITQRGGSAWPVEVLRLSTSGASLVIHDLKPVGLVLVSFHRPHRSFTCQVPMRVMRAVEHDAGETVLYCTFARELSKPETQGLLGEELGPP